MGFSYICTQIPPPGKGTLYIRPILFGSGPILGSFPIPETTFTAFACPVGRYHKVTSVLVVFLLLFTYENIRDSKYVI